MKEVQFFHVDAFTDQAFGGNAAGVVPDAQSLTESEMQNIARELNLSETAFILPAADEEADFTIRYFTPTSEIDFCGHATLGLSWVLATEFGWAEKKDYISLKTNIGIVPVKWELEEGSVKSVSMTQITPKTKEAGISKTEISRLAGVAEEQIDDCFPIKLGFTGNWHLLVPVKTRAAIDSAVPQTEELASLNREQGASTTHLFTFDSGEGDCKLYTRDFAPAVGIAEDPVTGSANGALAGYLVLEGILEREKDHHFKIAQGHAMNRPGELDVSITQGDKGPVISVGGKAVPMINGIIKLN